MNNITQEVKVLKHLEIETDHYRVFYESGQLHISDKLKGSSVYLEAHPKDISELSELLILVAEKAAKEGI